MVYIYISKLRAGLAEDLLMNGVCREFRGEIQL